MSYAAGRLSGPAPKFLQNCQCTISRTNINLFGHSHYTYISQKLIVFEKQMQLMSPSYFSLSVVNMLHHHIALVSLASNLDLDTCLMYIVLGLPSRFFLSFIRFL